MRKPVYCICENNGAYHLCGILAADPPLYFLTGNEKSTCVGMRADQPIGLWENLNCTQKGNYICQFPRTGGFTTIPTTPTPYPNVPCPTGWLAVQGNCYYVSVYSLTAYINENGWVTFSSWLLRFDSTFDCGSLNAFNLTVCTAKMLCSTG